VFVSQLPENGDCCEFRLCYVYLIVWTVNCCNLAGMFVEVHSRENVVSLFVLN